jgi:hypothetical protein
MTDQRRTNDDSSDDADRGRSRRRRRTRTKEDSKVSEREEAPETEELESVPPATVFDEDSGEDDTLSDWNGPSWNELIASLYRPDR